MKEPYEKPATCLVLLDAVHSILETSFTRSEGEWGLNNDQE